MTKSTSYLSELHKLIINHFNVAEIRTLCLDLDVDYESIAGEEKESKFRELVLGLARNGRLPELINRLQQTRPRVDWPPIPEDFNFPETLNTYDLERLSPEDGEAPYKGLDSFSEKDVDLFFGRDAIVSNLVNRLHNLDFIPILGASGSGKTSLLRAGLIPVFKRNKSLADGIIPPLGQWKDIFITPTANPLSKLATAIFPGDPKRQEELYFQMKDDHFALRRAVTENANAEKTNLLLIVDQFEELFTLRDEKYEAARTGFIENLLAAASKTCKIIISIRADFYPHCLQYEGLRKALDTASESIGPMTRQELTMAIKAPAGEGRWEIQPGLLDVILEDVSGEPGALPLLSLALLETWVKRRGRTLTLSGYGEAGGVSGAIAKTAETNYDELGDLEKAAARRIFIRLTNFDEDGPDTRRRISHSELEGDKEAQAVVQKLSKQLVRLMISSDEGIEVAHEALIREWPRLREWIDADRKGITIHRRITKAANEWQENEKDESFLDSGLRLQEAREWAKNHNKALTPLEHSFIEASKNKEERAAKRDRRLSLIGTALLVILVMLAIGTWVINGERNVAISAKATSESNASAAAANEARAITSEEQAKQQRQIMSLIAQSQSLLNTNGVQNSNLALSRLMTVAAMELDVDSQNNSLLTSWNYNLARNYNVPYQKITELNGGQTPINDLAWDDAGEQLASASDEGEITIWDTIEWEPKQSLLESTVPISALVWSPDSSMLAAANEDGTIFIWDTSNWKLTNSLKVHSDEIGDISWNNKGNLFASGSWDGKVVVWDTQTWTPIEEFSYVSDSEITSLAWSSDDQFLSAGSMYGEIIIWNTLDWTLEKNLADPSNLIFDLAWSTDDNELAVASGNGDILVWDSTNWQLIATLKYHSGVVLEIAWDTSGERIASASSDKSVIIWDSIKWEPLVTLTDIKEPLNSLTWESNGERLAAASDTGEIVIWDTVGWMPNYQLNGFSQTGAWNNDGKLLAIAQWNVSDNQQDIVLYEHGATGWSPTSFIKTSHARDINSIAWSPDGSLLASGDGGDSIFIWDLNNREPIKMLSHNPAAINDIAWNRDGRYLAAASGAVEYGILIWDAQSWGEAPVTILSDQAHGAYSLKWSPIDNRIASLHLFNKVIVWNPENWQPNEIVLQDNLPTAIDWSPDGVRLAIAASDGAITIWDTIQWEAVALLEGHTARVNTLDWRIDGKYLLSGSDDNNIIIWNTNNWLPFVSLAEHDSSVGWVEWNNTNEFFASSSGNIIITAFANLDFVNCELAGRNFTWQEWQRLFSDEPYRVTCSQWPVHPSVP